MSRRSPRKAKGKRLSSSAPGSPNPRPNRNRDTIAPASQRDARDAPQSAVHLGFGILPRERAMLHIRSILHPTDFSVPSNSALTLACSLARDQGAHLIVLHVVPTSLAA